MTQMSEKVEGDTLRDQIQGIVRDRQGKEPDGHVPLSYAQMARITGYSHNRVIRVVQALILEGRLAYIPEDGPNPRRYRVVE